MCGMGDIVAAGAVRIDTAAVALDGGVHPSLVDIAVEDLAPVASTREADGITVLRLIRKARDHDDIRSDSRDPALKRKHTMLVVCVEEREAFSHEAG